jgi:hypothetical protein
VKPQAGLHHNPHMHAEIIQPVSLLSERSK